MIRKGLMYAKKGKPYLRDYRGKAIYDRFVISPTDRPFTSDDKQPILNGKIVAEFDFEVEEISNDNPMFDTNYRTKSLSGTELMKFSCLTNYDLIDYLGDDKGYAIHIKNLHIFDEPRELSECTTYYGDKKIENAPKNMQKIFFSRKMKPEDWIEYILMSVKPEEMCRIANKEQITLVRKVVLKEML